MSTFHDHRACEAGWYPTADGDVRYWDGRRWAGLSEDPAWAGDAQRAVAAGAADGRPSGSAPGAFWDWPGWGGPEPSAGAIGGAQGSTPLAWHGDVAADHVANLDLRGAPLGPVAAFISAFRNIARFHGRASRSAYWWYCLWAPIAGFVAMIVVGMIVGLVDPTASDTTVASVMLAALLPFVLAHVSLLVRRLHDSALSGWLALTGLVPGLGSILLIALALRAPRDPNPYDLRSDPAPWIRG